MSLFQRSGSSVPASIGKPARRHRPASPSCRSGASSMLRLAQPASPRQSGLSNWLTRAATVFSPPAVQAVAVRASEFAPSRWLVGH